MKTVNAFGKNKYDISVKKFIDAYWHENFRPPTIREIQEAVGVRSSSHLQTVLERILKNNPYDIYYRDWSSRGYIPAWVQQAILLAGE